MTTLTRQSVTSLPTVRPCFGCGRSTRSSAQRLADFPDTVRRQNSFYCNPCTKELGGTIPDGLDLPDTVPGPAALDHPETITDPRLAQTVHALTAYMSQRRQRTHNHQAAPNRAASSIPEENR